MRTWMRLGMLGLCVTLAGCGGGGGGGSSDGGTASPPLGSGQTARFTVGGAVRNLRGSGLTLQIGQGETVAIQSGGAFAFPTSLANGTAYQVRVVAQPTNLVQACTVHSGSGTLVGADITNVIVDCVTATFRVRGSLSGLVGSGLKLYLYPYDGQRMLSTQVVDVSSDGTFEFPVGLEDGTTYEVRIHDQPTAPRQVCVLANDKGIVQGSDIDTPSVTCTTPTFRVGGTVSGLRGQGLVLTNNGADDLAIAANGAFTFTTPMGSEAPFNVQVGAQPTDMTQNCFVTNSSGVVFGADVNYVYVNCTATQQLGSSGDDEAHAAGTDASQNLYVAGRTTGELDGAANAGGWDGFLFKFSPGGELRWTRQLRSSGDEAIAAMDVMGNGDVLITGSTTGDLEGGNAGGEDIFVAKYDRDGNVQWIRQLGTSASDAAYGVDTRPDGSVYIAGKTSGALDGSTVAGDSDLFVAKLDASGALLWLRQSGTSAFDAAFGIDVDASGTIYVAGGTAGNLDGESNLSGGEVGFIVKYDSAGNRQSTQLLCHVGCWFNEPPATRTQSRINSIAVGLSGESYIAGWELDDASGAFTNKQAMDAMIQANGLRPWSQTRSRVGSDVEMKRIVLGKADGSLYMVGSDMYFTSNAAFANRVHTSSLTLFSNDIVAPGADLDAFAITSDAFSYAYVVGRTFGSLDGNPHLGGSDIFIVSYNDVGERL